MGVTHRNRESSGVNHGIDRLILLSLCIALLYTRLAWFARWDRKKAKKT
jgi:hypothetical protein